MQRRLETITNVAILVFVVAVFGNYIRGRLSTPQKPRQIQAGEEVPALPGYHWGSHPRTLVLALRYGCHYCEDSAPFYKKLVELERTGQIKDVHILAAFPDDAVVAQRMLQVEGLSLDYVPSVALRDFKISGTPAAILVDNRGRVMEAWVGQLSDIEERHLLASLTSSLKPRAP